MVGRPGSIPALRLSRERSRMPTPTANIRNFCIIAHIDHGKSTLADQFLLKTGAISERDIKAQTLDSMDLERERGITIRMHPVTIYHEHNGTTLRAEPDRHARPRRFQLRSVAQPRRVRRGHPARRCLPGRAGPDGRQRLPGDGGRPEDRPGAEQDRPAASPGPDVVIAEMEHGPGHRPGRGAAGQRQDRASASRSCSTPSSSASRAPAGDPTAPLKALDLQQPLRHLQGRRRLRPRDGRHASSKGQQIKLMRTGTRVRHHRDRPVPPGHDDVRRAGRRAGRLLHGQHQEHRRRQHRRHRHRRRRTRRPSRWPATRSRSRWSTPGLYPVNNNEFEDLREALGKLKLNDSQLHLPAGSVSDGLGFGFRCGFLGMLHREIIQQRLEARQRTWTWCRPPRTSPTRS